MAVWDAVVDAMQRGDQHTVECLVREIKGLKDFIKDAVEVGVGPSIAWRDAAAGLRRALDNSPSTLRRELRGGADRAGWTLLHFAVRAGLWRTVTVLLALGADPLARNCTNETPRSLAGRGTRIEAAIEAALLLERSAKQLKRSARRPPPSLLGPTPSSDCPVDYMAGGTLSARTQARASDNGQASTTVSLREPGYVSVDEAMRWVGDAFEEAAVREMAPAQAPSHAQAAVGEMAPPQAPSHAQAAVTGSSCTGAAAPPAAQEFWAAERTSDRTLRALVHARELRAADAKAVADLKAEWRAADHEVRRLEAGALKAEEALEAVRPALAERRWALNAAVDSFPKELGVRRAEVAEAEAEYARLTLKGRELRLQARGASHARGVLEGKIRVAAGKGPTRSAKGSVTGGGLAAASAAYVAALGAHGVAKEVDKRQPPLPPPAHLVATQGRAEDWRGKVKPNATLGDLETGSEGTNHAKMAADLVLARQAAGQGSLIKTTKRDGDQAAATDRALLVHGCAVRLRGLPDRGPSERLVLRVSFVRQRSAPAGPLGLPKAVIAESKVTLGAGSGDDALLVSGGFTALLPSDAPGTHSQEQDGSGGALVVGLYAVGTFSHAAQGHAGVTAEEANPRALRLLAEVHVPVATLSRSLHSPRAGASPSSGFDGVFRAGVRLGGWVTLRAAPVPYGEPVADVELSLRVMLAAAAHLGPSALLSDSARAAVERAIRAAPCWKAGVWGVAGGSEMVGSNTANSATRESNLTTATRATESTEAPLVLVDKGALAAADAAAKRQLWVSAPALAPGTLEGRPRSARYGIFHTRDLAIAEHRKASAAASKATLVRAPVRFRNGDGSKNLLLNRVQTAAELSSGEVPLLVKNNARPRFDESLSLREQAAWGDAALWRACCDACTESKDPLGSAKCQFALLRCAAEDSRAGNVSFGSKQAPGSSVVAAVVRGEDCEALRFLRWRSVAASPPSPALLDLGHATGPASILGLLGVTLAAAFNLLRPSVPNTSGSMSPTRPPPEPPPRQSAAPACRGAVSLGARAALRACLVRPASLPAPEQWRLSTCLVLRDLLADHLNGLLQPLYHSRNGDVSGALSSRWCSAWRAAMQTEGIVSIAEADAALSLLASLVANGPYHPTSHQCDRELSGTDDAPEPITSMEPPVSVASVALPARLVLSAALGWLLDKDAAGLAEVRRWLLRHMVMPPSPHVSAAAVAAEGLPPLGALKSQDRDMREAWGDTRPSDDDLRFLLALPTRAFVAAVAHLESLRREAFGTLHGPAAALRKSLRGVLSAPVVGTADNASTRDSQEANGAHRGGSGDVPVTTTPKAASSESQPLASTVPSHRVAASDSRLVSPDASQEVSGTGEQRRDMSAMMADYFDLQAAMLRAQPGTRAHADAADAIALLRTDMRQEGKGAAGPRSAVASNRLGEVAIGLSSSRQDPGDGRPPVSQPRWATATTPVGRGASRGSQAHNQLPPMQRGLGGMGVHERAEEAVVAAFVDAAGAWFASEQGPASLLLLRMGGTAADGATGDVGESGGLRGAVEALGRFLATALLATSAALSVGPFGCAAGEVGLVVDLTGSE